MPPAPSTASIHLAHRSSFYNRCRQDSAGSGSSSGSIRVKRKSSALPTSGTPSSLQQASILAVSKELACQRDQDVTSSAGSSAGPSLSSVPSQSSIRSSKSSDSARNMLLEDEYQEEAIQHMLSIEVSDTAG